MIRERLAALLVGRNRIAPANCEDRIAWHLREAAVYWLPGTPNGEVARLQRAWIIEAKRRAERAR